MSTSTIDYSKYYFCPGCLKSWKVKKEFMMCCSGCKGHVKETEWTIPLMMEYYGIPAENMKAPFKIWFPKVDRKPPRYATNKIIRRTQWDPIKQSIYWVDTSPAVRFLTLNPKKYYKNFIEQQLNHINDLLHQRIREHWNRLDPEVQFYIHFPCDKPIVDGYNLDLKLLSKLDKQDQTKLKY